MLFALAFTVEAKNFFGVCNHIEINGEGYYKLGIRAGNLPTETWLPVRKECISWTSFMSWASPNVKYAMSRPASAAAISWISAENGK